MLGTELVLRGVLESTKEHSPVGPIITVGRDPGASIVLVDDSTSLAHAEIIISDGKATLRDVGSDTGTFFGQKEEEGVRRLADRESVPLGEGDRIGFGQGESELYRVEQLPDGALLKTEPNSLPGLQSESTTDTTEHEGGERNEGDEPREENSHQGNTQPLAESMTNSGNGDEECCTVVVNVVRAEGLAGLASSSVFRRPKNKQNSRQYVRVSILDNREGREKQYTAVTSSTAASGPFCRWGEKGSGGEIVSLEVGDRGGASGDREQTLAEHLAEGTAVLELEIWSEASEGGGEEVLLGRGQAKPISMEDSELQWVALDPKGRIEVSVSISPPAVGIEEQFDQELVLERDTQTPPPGADDEQGGGATTTQGAPHEVSSDNPQKNRSPKWGLPRMPEFKHTLGASLGRASNLRARQQEAVTANEAKEKSAPPSWEEPVSQPVDEAEDEHERQSTGETTPPAGQIKHGRQENRVAIRGMQSIKESLQTRLLGTSGGKLRGVGRKERQSEDVEEVAEFQGEVVHSASRESARSGTSSNEAKEQEEPPGTSGAEIKHETSQEEESKPPDEARSESPREGGRHEERRNDRSSPLRSLLQDKSAADQAHQSEENDETGGDKTSEAPTPGRDSSSEEQPPGSPARGTAAHVFSALDAAISVKATAASKLKSTLSSPSLTSTLRKGFGWKKSKEEIVADASSPPAQTASLTAGADGASEPDVPQDGDSDLRAVPLEPAVVLVTVLRASDLPEIFAKTKFGRTKKNSTQDPFVRLSMCDVLASSSTVQGGGCDCRWGKKREGEVVEISIPSSNIPPAGLGASKLVVEVFNKASDELESDILLGRAEILVADWLGGKARWAPLQAKRSQQGGRVKLSLALKDSGKTGSTTGPSAIPSDDVAADSDGASNASPKAAKKEVVSLHPKVSSALSADIGDALHDDHEAAEQTVVEQDGSATTTQQDRGAPGTAQTTDSGRREESEAGVPPLALGSLSDENSNEPPLPEGGPSHAPTSGVVKQLEQQERAAENLKSCVGSTDGSSPSAPEAARGEGEQKEGIDIAIRVIEADNLYTPVPKGDVDTPKPDPYVVVDVCGERSSTSAIIGGGSNCRWPGTGEEVSLVASHVALTETGWGQAEAEGPYLVVEVYNQEGQAREADVFIGSANVRLREHVGCGPKWIEVHRRRKGRGRVLVDVQSRVLQQSMPSTSQRGDLNVLDPDVDQRKGPDTGSEIVNRDGRQGDSREKPKEGSREKPKEGSEEGAPLGTKQQVEKHASTDLMSRLTAGDNSSDGNGSLSNGPQKEEPSYNGSAEQAGSRTIEQPRQQGQASGLLAPCVDKGDGKNSAVDKIAKAEGAEACFAEDGDENKPLGVGQDPRHTTDASNAGVSDMLGRRSAGGSATALDLTTVRSTRDESAADIAEEQPKVGTDITPISSEGRVGSGSGSGSETRRSDRESSESLCQATRVDDEENDNEQDQEQPNGLQGSVHAPGGGGGDPEGGGDDVELSKRRSEGSHEVVAKVLDTRPPKRTVDASHVQRTTVDAQRVQRAREIVRRRRSAASSAQHTAPGVRVTSIVSAASSSSEQAQAATTIQGAFRGRIARRRVRACQRAAVQIQAAYRGHVDRKEFVALAARAKRAKAEEDRARIRRSRIALATQELNLLRSTPAQQLLRVDALRAEASACRIQRLWKRFRGIEKLPPRLDEGDHNHHGGVRDNAAATTMGTHNRSVTAPEIFSRSNRVWLSDMNLEALRLRVANRQRAKERAGGDGGDSLFLHPKNKSESPRENCRSRTTGGTVGATYKALLQWQEKAAQHTTALHRSNIERVAAAKRRRERLESFRKLQEQLLRPPKLSSSGSAAWGAGQSERKASEDSRRQHVLDVAADMSWVLAEEPAQRDRAQRAHTLAVAAAKARGKKSWATSLPPDVGYDELIDIRTVQAPWPTPLSSAGLERRFGFGDGSVRNQNNSLGERGCRTSNREFDSDEASLWWYTYARMEGPHAMGRPHEDPVFTELLERAKTTATRRKNKAEQEEEQYQLRVAQHRQMIVDKVIHRHQIANCPSLSSVRRRVTAAQLRAAITIQAHIRGFLERKTVAVLRAEMRVFGALQVLVNELRQPELEDGDTTNSLAVILAEHVNGHGENRVGLPRTGRRSRLPRPAEAVRSFC